MTVADLDEATQFTDMFGCQILYTMGPFSGTKGSFMRVYADTRTCALSCTTSGIEEPVPQHRTAGGHLSRTAAALA